MFGIEVYYSGGQSRNSELACDHMLATIYDEDMYWGDEIYVEAPVDTPYEELKQEFMHKAMLKGYAEDDFVFPEDN